MIEILGKIANGKFPSPRSINKDLEKSLESICLKSLEYNEKNRYASAKIFSEDIYFYLQNKKTQSEKYYTKKKIQTLCMLAIIIPCILLGGYFTLVSIKKRNIAKDKSLHQKDITSILKTLENKKYTRENIKQFQRSLKKQMQSLNSRTSTYQVVYELLIDYFTIWRLRLEEKYTEAKLPFYACFEKLNKKETRHKKEILRIKNAFIHLYYELHFITKDYDKIIELKNKNLSNKRHRFYYAYSLYKTGNIQKSIEKLGTLGTPEALYHKGHIYYLQRQYAKALTTYKSLLQHSQKYYFTPQLQFEYCASYLQVHKHFESEQDKQEVRKFLIELKGESLLWGEKKQKQYKKALAKLYLRTKQYKKVLAVTKNIAKFRDEDLYYIRGEAFFYLRKYEKTQQDFTTALKINPNKVGPFHIRIKTLFELDTPWYLHDYQNVLFTLVAKSGIIKLNLFQKQFHTLHKQYGKIRKENSIKQFDSLYKKLRMLIRKKDS